MAFGFVGSEFIGSTLDETLHFVGVSVGMNGPALRVQGKYEHQGGGAILPIPPGIAGSESESWYYVDRDWMPKHKKKVVLRDAGSILVAAGTARLYAKSYSWWWDDEVKLGLTVRTRLFQPAGFDTEVVQFTKWWKKKGGTKTLNFQSGYIGPMPDVAVDTSKDLFVIREMDLTVTGDGTIRIHFGWPDVKKFFLTLLPTPPLFYFSD